MFLWTSDNVLSYLITNNEDSFKYILYYTHPVKYFFVHIMFSLLIQLISHMLTVLHDHFCCIFVTHRAIHVVYPHTLRAVSSAASVSSTLVIASSGSMCEVEKPHVTKLVFYCSSYSWRECVTHHSFVLLYVVIIGPEPLIACYVTVLPAFVVHVIIR